MSISTKVWPSAAILLTGISGSGKTTLAGGLVRRLIEYGITDVTLIDGEQLRARLQHRYGYSVEEREAVWQELIKEARQELDADKVVVIAAIAHRVSMRAAARKKLKPFFEVHLDCPIEVCAARDEKGHYKRAFAGEYDCFIGVTHPYELSKDVELRIDTATLSEAEAGKTLAESVIDFLATADTLGPPPGEWVWRRFEALMDRLPPVEMPRYWDWLLQNARKSKPMVSMQRASCAQLMVVFGGMDAYLGTQGMMGGMSPLEFLKLSGLFGRNLTWIRDPFGENFASGISEELPSAEALAEWIRSYARSLPHVRDVHGLGYSSGSYGALMIGHLCRMKSVIVFSPRTARPRGSEEALERLKTLLMKHNGETQYQLWYSSLNQRDEAFCNRMADCPGVTVHPYDQAGDDHTLIRYLALRGILRTLLPPFMPAEGYATRSMKRGQERGSVLSPESS